MRIRQTARSLLMHVRRSNADVAVAEFAQARNRVGDILEKGRSDCMHG